MNKAMILKIVAIVVVICFFLPFATVSYFGIGASVSGFTMAFSFVNFGVVLYLLALLAAAASAVFGFLPGVIKFMPAQKFCLLLEAAVAVLILLGGIINGLTGAGWWIALILAIGYVAFDMFGDRLLKR